MFKVAFMPNVTVPLAASSKEQVCGRSPAKFVGSNPTGGMDICLLCFLRVVRRRPDVSDDLIIPREESYRLWCVCVSVCDLETS